MSKRTLAVTAALSCLAFASGCGGDDDASSGSVASDEGGEAVSCTYTQSGEPSKPAELPPDEAAYSGDVAATVSTSAGDLGVTLDAEGAPCTVNSFGSLAEQGYFDDTSCHRLTSGGSLSVLQCGDPTASGSGGPGYAFPDELTGDETYPAGTLAMANAGPDTNGSQFFVVYEDSQLDPAYTVFGTVDEAGLEAVREAAAAGSNPPGDGAPLEAVTITGVTLD